MSTWFFELDLPLALEACFDYCLDFEALDEAAGFLTLCLTPFLAPCLLLAFFPICLLPCELVVVGTKIAIDCPGLSATGILSLFQAAMLEGVTSCRLAKDASVSPF